MNTYPILKNVPVPPRYKRRHWTSCIDWPSLQIGDCVEIPIDDMTNVKSSRGDLYQRAIQFGMKISTRVDSQKIKIWRVE